MTKKIEFTKLKGVQTLNGKIENPLKFKKVDYPKNQIEKVDRLI